MKKSSQNSILQKIRKPASKGLGSNLFAKEAFTEDVVDKLSAMQQGYVSDPELSKLLTVINIPETILAERLDCAYAIYVRCVELGREGAYSNPIDDAFLKDMQRTYLNYVNDVLGGGKKLNDIQRLMDERAHVRMRNYEYIPGKATAVTVTLPSTEKTTDELRQFVDGVFEDNNLLDVVKEYQAGQHLPVDQRVILLAKIYHRSELAATNLESYPKTDAVKDNLEIIDNLSEESYQLLSKILGESNPEIVKGFAMIHANAVRINYRCEFNDVKGMLRTGSIIPSEMDQRINELVENGSVLSVNFFSRMKDVEYETTYYTTGQRDAFRIVMSHGVLCKETRGADNIPTVETFSSSKMTSHSGKGYCAYTLNLNGEISVFKHKGMSQEGDAVHAHSSMNAGNVVLCAGEMKIEDGRLLELTDHSGHYQPTVNHIYEALGHFNKHGIDTSDTKITIYDELSGVKGDQGFDSHGSTVYTYKAVDVCHFLETHRTAPAAKKSTIDDPNLAATMDKTKSSLNEYISKTGEGTTNAWYKMLRFKDDVIKKVTNNPNYVGRTEAKHRIASLMLKDLNALTAKESDTLKGQLANVTESITTKVNQLGISSNDPLSKLCQSLEQEAQTIRFEPPTP